MASARYHRQRAEELRKLAASTQDENQAYAYRLRAIEFEYLADQAEAGGKVQQRGTQPPTAPPAGSNRPVQQQQQILPKKDE